MITNIALRELKTLFYSPLAWSILAVLQAILAYIFLSQVEMFLSLQARLATFAAAPGLTDLVVIPLFTSAAIILLLTTPLLTMRLVSEERRNQTLSLLLSAPVSNVEIILGKFLGIYGFFLIIIFLITLMPLSLLLSGDLDLGKLSGNVLGLALLCSAFIALGLYMSCLSAHPTLAAVTSFGLLILLWILDWTAGLTHQSSAWLEYFSLLSHYQTLQTGLLDSKDVSYYLLFCATFLMLSIRRLENDRLQR